MHTSKEINPDKPQSEVIGIMTRKVQEFLEGNAKSMPEAVYIKLYHLAHQKWMKSTKPL